MVHFTVETSLMYILPFFVCLFVFLHSCQFLASSQCSTGSVWLDGSILSSSNGTQVAGLLMVCRDGVWGTVQTVSAIHLWSEKNALVACRSLGFEGALNIIPATQ